MKKYPGFALLLLVLLCLLVPLAPILGRQYANRRYDAPVAEKQAAQAIRRAAFGDGYAGSDLDYCIPHPDLPMCSAEFFESALPGSQCNPVRCRLGHVTVLSLRGGQLREVPLEITQLPGLEELSLSGNQLANLRSEIGQLSSLTSLDLSNNRLTGLPGEIAQLDNLEELNLSGNQLTDLPAEIGQIRNLRYLNIGGNPLGGPLPGFLTALNLREFRFTETGLCVPVDDELQAWLNGVMQHSISSLDRSFAMACALAEADRSAMLALYQIPGRPEAWDADESPCAWSGVTCNWTGHVTGLELGGLQMAELPAEIGRFSHLQFLHLANNRLTKLPGETGQLLNLEYLSLEGNQLTSLPPEIGSLANLHYLYLNNNRLTGLPAEIGQLRNLRYLYLSSNQLIELNPEISLLAGLEILDVSDNPLDGPLPLFLTQMPRLKFEYVDTGLCVPDEPAFLDWLKGQARQVYVYENGELVPLAPDADLQWRLANSLCK